MTRNTDGDKRLKSITVRLPEKSYMVIREYADSKELSMNTVISDAVAEYGARVSRREAIERIRLLLDRQRERRGPTSDSVELLREMRVERSESRGETKE